MARWENFGRVTSYGTLYGGDAGGWGTSDYGGTWDDPPPYSNGTHWYMDGSSGILKSDNASNISAMGNNVGIWSQTQEFTMLMRFQYNYVAQGGFDGAGLFVSYKLRGANRTVALGMSGSGAGAYRFIQIDNFPEYEVSILQNTWYLLRLYYNGATGACSARVWKDGDPEPTAWQVTDTDAPYGGSDPVTGFAIDHVAHYILDEYTIKWDWIDFTSGADTGLSRRCISAADLTFPLTIEADFMAQSYGNYDAFYFELTLCDFALGYGGPFVSVWVSAEGGYTPPYQDFDLSIYANVRPINATSSLDWWDYQYGDPVPANVLESASGIPYTLKFTLTETELLIYINNVQVNANYRVTKQPILLAQLNTLRIGAYSSQDFGNPPASAYIYEVRWLEGTPSAPGVVDDFARVTTSDGTNVIGNASGLDAAWMLVNPGTPMYCNGTALYYPPGGFNDINVWDLRYDPPGGCAGGGASDGLGGGGSGTGSTTEYGAKGTGYAR